MDPFLKAVSGLVNLEQRLHTTFEEFAEELSRSMDRVILANSKIRDLFISLPLPKNETTWNGLMSSFPSSFPVILNLHSEEYRLPSIHGITSVNTKRLKTPFSFSMNKDWLGLALGLNPSTKSPRIISGYFSPPPLEITGRTIFRSSWPTAFTEIEPSSSNVTQYIIDTLNTQRSIVSSTPVSSSNTEQPSLFPFIIDDTPNDSNTITFRFSTRSNTNRL